MKGMIGHDQCNEAMVGWLGHDQCDKVMTCLILKAMTK